MCIYKKYETRNTVFPIYNDYVSPGTHARAQLIQASEETEIESLAGTSILSQQKQTRYQRWREAFKQILPIFIAMHIAFFVVSCLAVLFQVRDFQEKSLPLSTLWQSWYHWDTGHFTSIALHGYDHVFRTAFFPLFPFLERCLMFITRGDAFVAGLFLSNMAQLILFTFLYQLIKEDFGAERASATVFYLALFPSAFFLTAAYNEALFLCLSIISFYSIRHGCWWQAGFFGFCAGLTRSIGLLMLIPFFYEYLRQHDFHLKKIRFDVFAGGLIPAAPLLFGLYCFFHFHDFLAFAHAEGMWQRQLHGPWHGILGSIKAIVISDGFLSFQALRNLLDLGLDLLVGMLLLLSLVGSWRFPRALRSYSLYGIALYLFLQMFPKGGSGLFPLESMSRYLLEIFPLFIVMAGFATYRIWHINYVILSSVLLFFLLTQFLNGHWVL